MKAWESVLEYLNHMKTWGENWNGLGAPKLDEAYTDTVIIFVNHMRDNGAEIPSRIYLCPKSLIIMEWFYPDGSCNTVFFTDKWEGILQLEAGEMSSFYQIKWNDIGLI